MKWRKTEKRSCKLDESNIRMEGENVGNRRYGKLLVIFFGVMLALTIVSRGADSVTVARVTAENVNPGTLAHRASASGTIQATDQKYIYGIEGAYIEKIHVGVGQQVKQGDVLFTLEENALDQQLADGEGQLAELRIEVQKAERSSRGSDSARTAVEDARRKLDRATKDSDFNTSLNDGKQLLADKRAIEDAQAQLEAAQRAQEEEKSGAGLDLELAKVKLREKETAVNRLRKLSQNGDQIRAEMAGIVGSLTAEAGKQLTGDVIGTLIPQGAQYVLEAELDAKDGQYLKIGDPISVTMEGKRMPLTGATIQSLQNVEGKMKVTVSLPEKAQLTQGASAEMEQVSVSQSYGATIPLSALRGNPDGYYVLAVKEENTVLGKKKKAERVEVTLLDKDGKKAAIQETLKDPIICTSSKPIDSGDRVRVVSDDVQ